MKLYLVRLIESQEAVGIFWSSGGDELWWQADQVVAPGRCEWTIIRGSAGIIWPGNADRVGVERELDDGFSMVGAQADNHLSDFVDSWRPLKWTAFDPAPPELREALKAKASA